MTIISTFTCLSLLCFWILALIAKMNSVLKSFDDMFFFLHSKCPSSFPVTHTHLDQGAFCECRLLSCLENNW